MKQQIKAGVRAILRRVTPSLLKRIWRGRRKRDPIHLLSTQWQPPAAALRPASDSHPVLSNPALSLLEYPSDLRRFAGGLSAAAADALEPVTELGQTRQSAAPVCFVLPVSSDDPEALHRSVQSVLRQTDPGWELLLCTPEVVAKQLDRWLEIDWRVRRYVHAGPMTEAEVLLNAAIQATTPFIGLLGQGDVVDDDLVKSIGIRVMATPAADLIYTDEASQPGSVRTGAPFYKPDWSPEHELSVHMLGRFLAVRKALLLDTTVPSSRTPEAAEYELVLSLTRRARRIVHIDEALYVRDARRNIARPGGFFPPNALDEACAAVERHARQEQSTAIAAPSRQVAGALHVRWPVPSDVPVTLLILTGLRQRELPGRGRVTLATHFVKSIFEKSSATGYRLIVVDDGKRDAELEALLARHGHVSHSCPKHAPFSFAYKANFASSLVEAGIVVLLNDDLEVVSPDWIQELAGQAARPGVGAAGCRLLYADGTLQHAGIGLGMGLSGTTGHLFHEAPADGAEYAGLASIDRDCSAVTGAVMAYRKDVFELVGGFDERLRTDYNDVDFCLKCAAHGLRVVYTGAVTLYHFHNSSLKREHDSAPERDLFLARWHEQVTRDPYLNKNFQLRLPGLPLVPAP